jgi:YD repeat-containing protein
VSAARGEVSKVTKPNGVTIGYTYEDREMLATRIYKDAQGQQIGQPDTFTYHPNRLLSTAHGGLYNTDVDRSNLNADYDMANRLLAERQNIGAGAKTVGYSYTADSLLDTLTYPGGTAVSHTYTSHRLMDLMKIGGVQQADNDYDTADRLVTRTLANDTSTTWSYDANSRVTHKGHFTTFSGCRVVWKHQGR